MTIDLEHIKRQQSEAIVDVEIPCWGGSIKVRSFTMATALAVREAETAEQQLLLAASKLIVEPDLDNEAGRTMLASMTPTEFNELWTLISETSGIDMEAEKKS